MAQLNLIKYDWLCINSPIRTKGIYLSQNDQEDFDNLVSHHHYREDRSH